MARLKLPLKEEPSVIWLGIMYRDGGNYKTFFASPVKISEYINRFGKHPKIGDELEMEQIGIEPDDVYELTGSEYDDELDHNILEVIEILPAEPSPEMWNIIYPEGYDESTGLINEILTRNDIDKITSMINSKSKRIAREEMQELEKEIKTKSRQQDDNNKKYDSHLKDSEHHLDTKAIEKIAKDNDKQLETDIEKMVKSELDKVYKDKNFEKSVQDIVTDTLVSFYKTMWVKRGFWQNSLVR